MCVIGTLTGVTLKYDTLEVTITFVDLEFSLSGSVIVEVALAVLSCCGALRMIEKYSGSLILAGSEFSCVGEVVTAVIIF